jgi:hypothetical protein
MAVQTRALQRVVGLYSRVNGHGKCIGLGSRGGKEHLTDHFGMINAEALVSNTAASRILS